MSNSNSKDHNYFIDFNDIHSLLNTNCLFTSSKSQPKDYFCYACEKMSNLLGVTINLPDRIDLTKPPTFLMKQIAELSDIKIREIELKKNWHRKVQGSLLAFIQGKACLLVPSGNSGYQILQAFHKPRRFNPSKDVLDGNPFSFTKPLPDKPLSLKDILHFIYQTCSSNFCSLLYLQLTITVLLLTIPVLVGFFFDNITSLAETDYINQLSIILILNTSIFILLSINQTLILVGVRTKMQASLIPAMWDRILKIPLNFFKNHRAGELAQRIGALNLVQEILTQSGLLSILGLAISALSFGLMLYYNPQLAIYALSGCAVFSIILLVINYRLLCFRRLNHQTTIEQAGFVFQVITGIIKFKASGSESKAFERWSKLYTKLLQANYQAGRKEVSLNVLNGSTLILMTLGLFCLFYMQTDKISIGEFIAFNSAFSLFFSSFIAFSNFTMQFTHIIPMYEKAMILLKPVPQKQPSSKTIVKLHGNITIRNLSFRYSDQEPLILKNINLTIKKGDVLGITGESGCGKSTLLRLLLGLEKATEGRIYYDNINMDQINLSKLRKQIGLVFQKSQLLPGSILDNILAGEQSLTRREVWDLLYRLDIHEMVQDWPMGLDTMVSDGMQTLSGGEIQRIMLARALIRAPRILFFDEATSALDNACQDKVHQYLQQLEVTQVIIAHRLSTLEHTDKIIVFEKGQISQIGNYNDLLNQPGYFATLAKQQINTY